MVYSFERVLKILELGNRFDLCSSALARELNCTKRTAQRYMHELESEGYLYPVGAKFFKGDTYFLLTDKSKKLLGIDMTNNQKIELAQANKAQLIESCKQCLNCTAWVPLVTDWDVMQSGYSDEQIYPELKQFDLTIEQMRQILDNAPDGSTGFVNVEDDKYNCYVKFTPEWSKQNKHAYWAKDALTGEYRWSFMANMFGGHDLTCGLVELSDLQKYVDQYVEQKPKQELEVLEMHDVPCTTVVING